MNPRESIRLANRLPGFKSTMMFGAGSGAVAGLFAIAQAPLMAAIINDAFLRHEGLQQLRATLLLWLGLLVVRWGFVWISGRVLALSSVRVKGHLRRQLTQKLVELGPARRMGDTGEVVNTIGQGVDGIDGFITKYLPQIAYVSVLPIASLMVVYHFDIVSGLIFTITGPIIVIFMVLIGKSTQESSQRRWRTQTILSGHFLDTLQGLTTLKIFNRSHRQIGVIRKLGEQYRIQTMKTLRIAFLSSFVLELFAMLGTAMVAVGIGLRLLSGHLSFAAGLTVLILAGEYFMPLRNMGSEFHTAMNGISGLSRVFEILDEPLMAANKRLETAEPSTRNYETCRDDNGVRGLPHASILRRMNAGAPTLALRHVTFRHQASQKPALHDVTMSMLPETMTAVVGPSGAGKSTLFAIIMGFASPDEGDFTIDGQLLDKTWVRAWRKRIMYIPQNPYLFEGTIRENVQFANPSATEHEWYNSIHQSGLSEMIAAMPNGFDTRIGSDGYGLSGGQAQRIAIARAFLHGGEVLVMDEPSAHLDLQSEQCLRTALETLKMNRTTFVIAHRLSTIATADKVIVLSGGRIVQSGTPRDLLDDDGPYRNLVSNGVHLVQEEVLS